MFRKAAIALLGVGAALPGWAAAPPAPVTLLADPPQAQAGECWAVVYVPPRLEKRTETVVKTPASERIEKTPPRYEWVTEQVTIPAGERRVVVKPGEYEVTTEQVLVSPAGTRQLATPAKYRTIEERVATGRGTVLQPHPVTGELCLVEGPTAYKIVKKRVLVEPAGKRTVEADAKYKTVTHRTLITKAETKRVQAPERVITKRVKKLVEPAGERVVPVPATFEDIIHLEEVAPGRSEWRAVLCRDNVQPGTVRRLQQALKKAGHDPGSLDGQWGQRTGEALRAYQEQNGLRTQGITRESLEKLGVVAPA